MDPAGVFFQETLDEYGPETILIAMVNWATNRRHDMLEGKEQKLLEKLETILDEALRQVQDIRWYA